MRLRQSATFGLVATLAAVQAFGQLRAHAELVLINASVADRDGRFVTGLDASRFQVFDEKRPVAIRSFSMDDAPVTTIILLDASESMKRNIAHARAGLSRYLSAAIPGDEFCLIAFAKNVSNPCGFTANTEAVQQQAANAVPNGRTTLVDALMLGLNEIKKGRNARKVLLILSDGIDTGSRYNWREARRLAEETNACLYAVVPKSWDDRDGHSLRHLEQVVETTGGALYEITDGKSYPAFLNELDIRRQYLIGFTPSQPARDGKYRRVNVQLSGAGKTNMRVHWRRGYYASDENYGRP